MAKEPDTTSTPTDASIHVGGRSDPLRDPIGITLLVVDGPHDGLVFSDAAQSITLGRGIENHITLSLDKQVSSQHCIVQFSSDVGCWILEDVGSTNGTWFDGRDVRDATSPQELGAGAEFVIGTSVLRCRDRSGEITYLPDASQVEEEVRRLASRLDLHAARGFGAASMVALRESSFALTDRHLLLGLVSAIPDAPMISHGHGPISTQFLGERVCPNEYWTASKSWIGQIVRSDGRQPALFADQVVPTPRVLRVFQVAAGLAESHGADQITAENLLYGLFNDEGCRLREWFLAERGDLKRLLSELSRQRTGISKLRPERSKTERIPTDSAVLARPSPPPKVVDPAALDLANAALGTAAKYRFASAADRHGALKETVTKVVAGVSADRRGQLLRQLRECFPVVETLPVQAGDSVQLQRRIAELEERLKQAEGGARESAIPIPWSDVLSSEGRFHSELIQPADSTSLDLVHKLVGFSLALERFIIGFVAGMMQRDSMSGRLSLPGFKTTIRRTINLILSGQQPSDDFRLYLAALETWLVATITAYHTAPEDWFKEYWAKASPSRIEASVPAKFLNDAKCWNQYKNVVRRISPDLVGDEIHALVRENSRSQYDELIAMRRES